MRNLFTLLCLLAAAFVNAQQFNYQQLFAVNAEWQHHREALLLSSKYRASNAHIDNIQVHLDLVYQQLSRNQPRGLNTTQINNRNYLLSRLNDYAAQKEFPINTFIEQTNPVFIDDRNVHCAVGYLMQQSGAAALAQQINKEQRFAYIKDIKVAGVQEWANENGFTLDELAWIQPGYAYTGNIAPFTSGVNGEVLAMCVLDTNQILIGGNFSQIINGPACNNLALATKTGATWTLTPFFAGANGPIHALYFDGIQVYIGGNFSQINGAAINNVARYSLTSSGQPFTAMGMLDSTVHCFTIYKNQLYAGGAFDQLISRWDGNAWTPLNPQFVNFLYGKSVNALQVFNNELYIGGDFEMATGALRTHLAIYDSTYYVIKNMGTNTAINCFAIHNNKLYAAGEFNNATGDSSALYRLDGDEWNSVVKPNLSGGLFGVRAKQMLSVNNKLVMVGEMNTLQMMFSSKNIIAFDMSGATPMAENLSSVEDPVNCLTQINNELFFGGAFHKPNSIGDALAKLNSSVLPIKQADRIVTKLIIRPNPANNYIELHTDLGFSNNIEVYLFDNVGKLACNCKVEPGTSKVDILSLSLGQYRVVVYDKGANKTYTATFVKN